MVCAAWVVGPVRPDGLEDLGLDGQVRGEAGALGQRGQLEAAAVRLYDALRDRQAQPGSGALPAAGPSVAGPVARGAPVAPVAPVARGARAGAAGGLERRGGQFRW